MDTDAPREVHTPQISKRSEALINLANYFESFLRGVAVKYTEDALTSCANQMAIDAYKIVKKAEGFE